MTPPRPLRSPGAAAENVVAAEGPILLPFAPGDGVSNTYPLEDFYAALRQPLPPIIFIRAEEMPEPYRRLLAHEGDMTSRIETFYQRRTHIRVGARHRTSDAYYRQISLELDGSGEPVEFAATRIFLDVPPPAAREGILREERPLGAILREAGVTLVSRPRAFLRVQADDFIGGALRLRGRPWLYGRRNTLLDGSGRALAETVELLPPSPELENSTPTPILLP